MNEGGKTLIISTSITKGINPARFNRAYDSDRCRFQRFPGGKAKKIKDYIPSHLYHEKPDTIYIQCGGNDLQDAYDPSLVSKLAADIIEAGVVCKNNKYVKTVFIGGVTIRRQTYTRDRCRELNNLLREACKTHNFVFVDNSNIIEDHLDSDGVHLNEKGDIMLANNILGYFNKKFGNASS